MNQNNTTLNQEEIRKTLATYIQNNQLTNTTAQQIETHLYSSKQCITQDQLDALIQTFSTLQQHYAQAKKHAPTPQPTPTQIQHSPSSKTKPAQHKQPNQSTQELTTKMQSIQNQLNDLIKHQEAWKDWIQNNTTTSQSTSEQNYTAKTSSVFPTSQMQPLSHIPKHPEGIIVLMRWLQYLVESCGQDGLADILDYYVDIEWITEEVRLDLMKYARGITEDSTKTKQNTISAKDHIQTLLYLQQLNGINYDNHFLERIDRQMEKLGREIEESNNRRTKKQN